LAFLAPLREVFILQHKLSSHAKSPSRIANARSETLLFNHQI
jgi:hypothetical protein